MNLIAKSATDRRIEQTIGPTLVELGFELVRVRARAAPHAMIQIMAQRPDGSMDIEDCGALHRAVESALGEADAVRGDYQLEVSSPGLDRPLTRLRDFEDYAGHRVQVETGEQINGRKKFRGRLVGLRPDGDNAMREIIVIDREAGETVIPVAALVDAHLTLESAELRELLAQAKHGKEK